MGAFCMREKIAFASKQKVAIEIEFDRLSQNESSKLVRHRQNGNSMSALNVQKRKHCRTEKTASKIEYYSKHIKQQAEAYLTGKYCQEKVCAIFKIRDRWLLRDWLNVNNSISELKRISGGSRMKIHIKPQKRTHPNCKEMPYIREQLQKDCQ